MILLVKYVDVFVIMDDMCCELCDVGFYIEDNWIVVVGLSVELLDMVDEVFDLCGYFVILGFVNMYYYMY